MSAVATAPRVRARDVHRRIVHALADIDRAEAQLVTSFGLMFERHLYRKLGYSSIYQYAELELSFSSSKTAQLIRICKALEELPLLRAAVEAGDLPWTKARLLASIATPDTEAVWIEEAQRCGRRHLEGRVKAVRQAFQNPERPALPFAGSEPRTRGGVPASSGASFEPSADGPPPVSTPSGTDPTGEPTGSDPDSPVKSSPASPPAGGDVRPAGATARTGAPGIRSAEDLFGGLANPPMPMEVPVTLSIRLTPAQYARYERLVRALRHRDDVGERYLDALAALAREERSAATSRAGEAAGERARPRHDGGEPPYQIVVFRCEVCGRGHLPTARGDLPIDPAVLRQAGCDSRQPRGERNVAAIPPSVRRQVLERDGHRCRGAGCGRTGFLEVHHRIPRSRGGSNRPDNLITLCSGCHRRTHTRDAEDLREAGQVSDSSPVHPRTGHPRGGPRGSAASVRGSEPGHSLPNPTPGGRCGSIATPCGSEPGFFLPSSTAGDRCGSPATPHGSEVPGPSLPSSTPGGRSGSPATPCGSEPGSSLPNPTPGGRSGSTAAVRRSGAGGRAGDTALRHSAEPRRVPAGRGRTG